MEFMLINLFLLLLPVAESVGEFKICNSSSITQPRHPNQPTLNRTWEIEDGGCKREKNMVIIHLTKVVTEVPVGSKCYVTGTVAGIDFCTLSNDTCVVVIPPDSSVKAETLKGCQTTLFSMTNNVLPVLISFATRENVVQTEFDLEYTVYEMLDEENQDSTVPSIDVSPKEENCCQDKQKSQSALLIMTIVFGSLFGITTIAFSALLCRFRKIRKNDQVQDGHDANIEPVYTEMVRAKNHNNSNEAEITVNELYHM